MSELTCQTRCGRKAAYTRLVAIRAPSLPTDATWLNVSRPLTDEDLRGLVVLLHFWTYA
jgi:hypothetical protein